MIELRDDQIELIECVRAELRAGRKAVLAVASTGFGKTVSSAFMAKEAAARGRRVWFMCHLRNLLNQTSQAFWQMGIEHGMIAAGKPMGNQRVQVGTIGTIARRLDRLKAPDLLIVDECMTGDTVVMTDAGPQRLDETSVGSMVMCYNGENVVFSRVSAAWCSGVRQIYEVTTSCGKKIRCTDNHKIKTKRGWVRTDELMTGDVLFIANAAAGKSFSGTPEEEKGASFLGIKSKKEAGNSGIPSGSKCLRADRFASAGVASMSEADTQNRWTPLSSTGGRLGSIGSSLDTNSDKTAGTTRQLLCNNKQYTEHFWGIRQSCIRTVRAPLLGLSLLTERFKKSGLNTRRCICTAWASLSGKLQMLGMARGVLSACQHAANFSNRFMTTCVQEKERSLRMGGSIELERSAFAGGFATTEASLEMDSTFIQRAFLTMSRSSLKSGLHAITGKSLLPITQRVTSIFTSTPKLWTRYTQRSSHTYQDRCDISFSTVACVRKLNEWEPVYDITVPSTGNFFANGVLVHNCHLAMASTWIKVIDWAKAHGAIIVGNSATPERLDGKGLGYIFDSMVEARPMRWLIDQGRLSDYVIYSTAHRLDTSQLKTRAGDYAVDQAEELMSKPKLIGDAVDHWIRYARGKRTIAYCVTIKHSKATAAEFNARGISAIHVDGEAPASELKEAISGFADGKYQVLCNVQLMTTGFDLSSQVGRDVPIEACILLRPTQSVALYLQMVGRALRRKPEPAIILDHAGCAMQHGLPDDRREWSLEGRAKRGRKGGDTETADTVQQCGQCFAIFRAGVSECPACGAPVEVRAIREIEVAEGELVKIDIERFRREQAREQGQARGLRELVALGIRRGMKNPAGWAANVVAARKGGRASAAEHAAARAVMAELLSEGVV